VDTIVKYQHQILVQARRIYYETPISDATKAAYLATPRHLFVKRYRVWGTKDWKEVTKENLLEHLGRLYTDHTVILFGDDDTNVFIDDLATIACAAHAGHVADSARPQSIGDRHWERVERGLIGEACWP
jgi:hypothetical protein